ncbi:hypothetical protein C8Q77DRAFT_1210348 [Trametes polyzona]|nr:hypothetical protein C8Q77DRAFT_1210348 [Trametes polyzona]
MSDRGYVNLIRHLARPASTLPLETLQASIAHYLARPPVPLPGSPTPLAAAALSSPLFRPYAHRTLSALALAFRHAVHLRVGVLKELAERAPAGLFARGAGVDVPGKLARWTAEVRAGFEGSEGVVRLACASGLLLGLEDWDAELRFGEKEGRARAKVEEEVVLALAEVVDEYAREGSGWENDFKRTVGAKGEEDPLALAVLIASQCAQCIAAERLQALPLSVVADVLMTTIDRSFYGGAFLAVASMSASTDSEGRVRISSATPFAQNAASISSSPYVSSMSSLARFMARVLTVLVESRRAAGWETIGHTLKRLQALTAAVERDWEKCPLARITKDEELADDDTRGIATATWSILKTILFTTLMISQSVLSAVVFVPNPNAAAAAAQRGIPSIPSPHIVALDVLRVLSHLSFVMPQFGGVASTSEGGLPELKRAFYMALDVLASDGDAAERFVTALCRGADTVGKGKAVETVPRTLLDARKAYQLACVEQLVPVLSEDTIRSRVFPLCLPHLWDPSYRETYESAHSVMLAIFAAHAKDTQPHTASSTARPPFAEKLVPMYAQCLVENSADGRLSTVQLCMAYAALVKSAGALRRSASSDDSPNPEGDSMAWFCIEVLLQAIRKASLESSACPKSRAPSEHLHRLHLALVACVPAVSLSLLPRLLDEVKAIITSLSADEQSVDMRDELVQALFKAILQDVGDAEKEYVVGWWLENRENLVERDTTSAADLADLPAARL